jgi:hypothetical protein
VRKRDARLLGSLIVNSLPITFHAPRARAASSSAAISARPTPRRFAALAT